MIAGHLGVALGARALRPRAPLVWLLVASIAPDILDGVYALAGVCSLNGVYSHSIPAIGVLAAVAMALAYACCRNASTAITIALMVFAHVLADWLTSQKVLWLHGPVVGLNLYRWPMVDFMLELPLIIAGWYILRGRQAAPRWAISCAALAALVAVQAAADVSLSTTKRFGISLHRRVCDVPT